MFIFFVCACAFIAFGGPMSRLDMVLISWSLHSSLENRYYINNKLYLKYVMGWESPNPQQGPHILKEVVFKLRHENRVGISLAKGHKKKSREREFEHRGKEIKNKQTTTACSNLKKRMKEAMVPGT